MNVESLPAVNACLNTISTIFLLLGYHFIQVQNKAAHQKCMIAAFITSTIFLACYVIYHFFAGHTVFSQPVWFKPFYLTLLATHILLAVAIVPLILAAFWFAFRKNWKKHKAVVRWTWPLWMYVSVTGVVVYLILYHIYPQSQPA
ncbi:MAG: DUF420 domain-containing protein [Verrucomicrobia bacterium]|nr:DUF420 domain-containing protein [Verrucomicrobiota bacterium]